MPRERIGVLISQNSGEAAGTLTDMIIREYVHDILSAVKRAVHLTPVQQSAIEQEVKSGRMAPDDTTLLGRLNCAAAGFICNRYGFMGPSYSVSAACATSLVALHSAIQMIRSGIIDGETRAHSRGARVHAVITSMGASNNHLGMVESSNVTQQMAIRTSFRGIPYGPDAVDLVECHATSTRQGDVEEVRGLKASFNSSKRTVITSFKSQIGHTLGASGINNLIRGVTAMKAGIFPPTLNYMHPDPEIDMEGSGLLIAPGPLDWKGRDGEPRRLQVNAFGFGGSNYVVQVEQAMDEVDTILVSPGREPGIAGEKGGGPPTLQGVSFFRTKVGGCNCRMAVVAQSEEEALTVIERSASLGEAGIGYTQVLKW